MAKRTFLSPNSVNFQKRTQTDTPSGLNENPKRRKTNFKNATGKQYTNNDSEIKKLDPAVPAEAQRIKTRLKMIQKGKNTAGYDEYIRKVPKHQRKRIKEHPMTPDHTLDLPNRRWQGQVKAWRIALHQFDPEDLKSDIQMEELKEKKAETPKQELKKTADTVQDSQIAKATSEGLLVDFASNDTLGEAEKGANEGVVDCTFAADKEIDQWENIEEQIDFDDSDDDLL